MALDYPGRWKVFMDEKSLILLADSSQEDRERIRAVLAPAQHDFVLLEAHDRPTLERLFKEHTPDLVLSDIVFPGFDDFGVVQLVNRESPHTPVIVVSGSGSEDRTVESLGNGATGYLSKHPEHLVKLPSMVHRALAVSALANSLREKEERYRKLFEDHVAIQLLIDAETGRIMDANRAAERFYGLSREELKQLAIQEINTLGESGTIARLKEAREGNTHRFEFRHRLKDGSIRDVEVYSSPLTIRGKRLLHSIVHDISRRKQAEAELTRLKTAVEQVEEGVVVTDRKGIILYANPAFERMTGLASSQVEGADPRTFLSPETRGNFSDLRATLRNRETWQGRISETRKDGKRIVVSATVSPVVGQDHQVSNYVAVIRDVTEHVLLEEQLKQAQRLESVGRLAGGVAHDFNNLLTIIMGFTELMLADCGPQHPHADSLRQVLEAGQRAQTLTRQLLAFSRRQTLRPQVIELTEVVRGLEKMLRRLIGEDIRLVTDYGSSSPRIKADPGQIEQVILNLAVNARDAMPDGGVLTIETGEKELDEEYSRRHLGTSPGKYALLAVSDNGCGMDEETRSRIFEPFFTTKPKEKGTGLGLATSYGIIKQSGGNIWCYSEPGVGTTFKIYLPVTEEPLSDTTAKVATAGVASPRPSLVLVVEDESSLAGLCREFLASLGYNARVTTSPAEAVELVEDQGLRPDILLTDVVMPGMNGKVLAQRLQKLLPDLKVLYMSGYTDNAVVHHGVLDPGTPFLQKPFSRNDLAAAIQRLLPTS